MCSWQRIEQTKGETEKRNSMNESEKMKKVSRNGLNGDTVNLVGAWAIVVIFLSLGVVMMLGVYLQNAGNVGYVGGSWEQSEWANRTRLNYIEGFNSFTYGVVWSESGDATGYLVRETYSSFLLPIRFIIALVFLLLGTYAMPKSRSRKTTSNTP